VALGYARDHDGWGAMGTNLIVVGRRGTVVGIADLAKLGFIVWIAGGR